MPAHRIIPTHLCLPTRPLARPRHTAWFSITIGYGMTYGGTDTLSTLEQILSMVATLIAVDAPRQIGWHLGNALRNGASLEEVRAVRRMALDVAGKAGVKWRGDVPDVEETETE